MLAGVQAAPCPEGTPVPVELYSCCSASGTPTVVANPNTACKEATSPAPNETSQEVDVLTPSEASNGADVQEACVAVPAFQSSRPAAGPVPSDVEGKCCFN